MRRPVGGIPSSNFVRTRARLTSRGVPIIRIGRFSLWKKNFCYEGSGYSRSEKLVLNLPRGVLLRLMFFSEVGVRCMIRVGVGCFSIWGLDDIGCVYL